MQKLKAISINLKERLTITFLYFVGLVIGLGLISQLTFVVLQFTGNEQIIRNIINNVEWRFDGNFKNTPGNIYYEPQETIWVESVVNNVKIGKLSGNRQLEFGVKNILEEYLQEKDIDLSPDAQKKLKVEIVYLDVLTTKKNVSIFHKNEKEVVIRMKGILYKDGKKEKEVVVEESSSEISMSTLVIDEGGKFNQTSLSNAIKKTSESLITKLFK